MTNPAKVAEYWAIQQQKKYTLEEATALFLKTFNVPKEMRETVLKAIADTYKRIKI
jgi:hypothetical protein